jgi:hypothetical protein
MQGTNSICTATVASSDTFCFEHRQTPLRFLRFLEVLISGYGVWYGRKLWVAEILTALSYVLE